MRALLAVDAKLSEKNRRRPLRWLHVALVLATGLSLAINPSDGGELRLAVTVQLLMLLTYPLGVVGSMCAFALIYPGIATPAEAYAVSTPLFVIAGYLQWNLLIPRLAGTKPSQSFPQNETPTTESKRRMGGTHQKD